eukprot:scaffold309642_cov26-Tisochrysis_lutea.AAC.2
MCRRGPLQGHRACSRACRLHLRQGLSCMLRRRACCKCVLALAVPRVAQGGARPMRVLTRARAQARGNAGARACFTLISWRPRPPTTVALVRVLRVALLFPSLLGLLLALLLPVPFVLGGAPMEGVPYPNNAILWQQFI